MNTVPPRPEIVVCGIPFGNPIERVRADLAAHKAHGITAVQTYTFWRDFEAAARGNFNWEKTDAKVRLIQEAGLKWVPFLLMGPKYAAPDWWLASPEHRGLKCIEHLKESKIESIWNPAFRTEISRVLDAFAAYYGPMNVIESIQPGICGDYGEAIFPVLGNWPGDYHTHKGYWCADEFALADARAKLGFAPAPLHKLPSRAARLAFIKWYQGAMTEYSEFWCAECRRAFPDLPVYLCTGGADDDTPTGALFSAQAKAAARHGGGIRLTNEVNKFEENFRLCAHTAAACEFYGAYLGLEPVGPMTTQGVRNRTFGSAAFGNRQVFHYYGNLFDPKTGEAQPAAEIVRDNAALIGENKAEKGIALYWPVDNALLEGAVPDAVRGALKHIRRNYPVSPVSEEMILDGALDGFGFLVMLNVDSTRREALEAVAAWAERGGQILCAGAHPKDIELDRVEAFDAAFGLLPDSEEAWGHHNEKSTLPENGAFPRLTKIKSLHAEKGWLGLHPATEKLFVAQEGPGGGEGAQESTRILAVSALFKRNKAHFFGGAVNLQLDPQACFADPGVFLSLLDDLCAASGIAPLGTLPEETARVRIAGKTLALTDTEIKEV